MKRILTYRKVKHFSLRSIWYTKIPLWN